MDEQRIYVNQSRESREDYADKWVAFCAWLNEDPQVPLDQIKHRVWHQLT
jgi:hypothetical protein